METWMISKVSYYFMIVLTVPMRNGNFHDTKYRITDYQSSYRTYEEWKQDGYVYVIEGKNCSYRTYEEWKRFLNLM